MAAGGRPGPPRSPQRPAARAPEYDPGADSADQAVGDPERSADEAATDDLDAFFRSEMKVGRRGGEVDLSELYEGGMPRHV